jgi:hypothetical protein
VRQADIQKKKAAVWSGTNPDCRCEHISPDKQSSIFYCQKLVSLGKKTPFGPQERTGRLNFSDEAALILLDLNNEKVAIDLDFFGSLRLYVYETK